MKDICKTAPGKMSTEALVTEHQKLDDLVESWGPAPQINDSDIQMVKRRRCALKTEAMKRVKCGDLEAMAYADTRQWEHAEAA